jgi:hypothetical protein
MSASWNGRRGGFRGSLVLALAFGMLLSVRVLAQDPAEPNKPMSEDEIRALIMKKLAELQEQQKKEGRTSSTTTQRAPATQPGTPPATQPRPLVPPGHPAGPAVTAQPTTGPTGKIGLTPTEFSFGAVWQGEPIEKEFTVTNLGLGPLTFDPRATCGCTLVSKPKSPLAPGESTTFKVSYDSKRAGEAHKNVIVTSNDPNQPQLTIPINGTVNPLLVSTPAMITWPDLDINSDETQVMRLENKYPKPLTPKLKEGQNFGKFEVTLQEVEPGQVYELKVKTLPPLTNGWLTTSIALETGVEQAPLVQYTVSGNVQPRVMVMPPRLFARSSNVPAPAVPTIVRVQYRTGQPLNVKEIRCIPESMKAEVGQVIAPVPGAKRATQEIKVTLPTDEDLPADARLEIVTDDPTPEFQKLVVQVVKAPVAQPRPGIPGRPQPPGAVVKPTNVQPTAQAPGILRPAGATPPPPPPGVVPTPTSQPVPPSAR